MIGQTRDTILVIGYGNELRGDDGAGPMVASEVAKWRLPHVRTLAVQQLVPELAESLADCRSVIFVDAEVSNDSSVMVRHLEPSAPYRATAVIGHYFDPRNLLGMAERLFGRSPPAWLVTIPVHEVGMGPGLSRQTQQLATEALSNIESLLETYG